MAATNPIHSGSLLLAEPFMADPNFKRTVVLICEHNEDGTLGFVLSKRSNLYLDQAMDGIEQFKAPLFLGGPVQTDTLHYIHRIGEKLEGSVQLAPCLFWGGNFETLKVMINNKQVTPNDIHFFLGYSGWAPGQLEEEMNEQSWLIHQAKAEHIFNPHPDDLWKTILKEMGGDYAMMVNFPEDPNLN
jgi:putative transcriptional regulator